MCFPLAGLDTYPTSSEFETRATAQSRTLTMRYYPLHPLCLRFYGINVFSIFVRFHASMVNGLAPASVLDLRGCAFHWTASSVNSIRILFLPTLLLLVSFRPSFWCPLLLLFADSRGLVSCYHVEFGRRGPEMILVTAFSALSWSHGFEAMNLSMSQLRVRHLARSRRYDSRSTDLTADYGGLGRAQIFQRFNSRFDTSCGHSVLSIYIVSWPSSQGAQVSYPRLKARDLSTTSANHLFMIPDQRLGPKHRTLERRSWNSRLLRMHNSHATISFQGFKTSWLSFH